MNLALRGISHNLGDEADSTFTHDLHKGLYFNYIMANPPFNLKGWYDSNLKNDSRWTDYSTPPESNANYAWILHILSHLKPLDGVAGFLLANGALGDSDTVEIRKKLIQNDKVEAIIILPRELFITTDISVTLWILNQNKKAANIMAGRCATVKAKSCLWICALGRRIRSRAKIKRKFFWMRSRSKKRQIYTTLGRVKE